MKTCSLPSEHNRFSLTNIGNCSWRQITWRIAGMFRATTLLAILLSATAFGALMPMALPNALAAPVATAGGLPKIDIQKSCRESSDALYGSTTASAYDTCVE